MRLEDVLYQPPEVVRRLRLDDDDVAVDRDQEQREKQHDDTSEKSVPPGEDKVPGC